MVAHDVPKKFGGTTTTNNNRESEAKKTVITQGVDEYISFNDIRRDLCGRQSPQDHQVSSIVLNSSLSDDSSSLTTITIDDSLTTLDGLNIDLLSWPCGFTQRSRSVRFKKVRFRHTYSNDHCHPSAADRPTPSQVRRLGLYEKIALYEQRPDLAPFYYAAGRLPPTPQIPPAAASNSLGIDELVLAPLDEAGEVLQIGQTWKASDETIVSVGSTDAVANFNYRDDVPYDEEEEVREQNDCTRHCRVVDAPSLLDVASGSDSRDDDNDDVGNIRDECPGNIIGGDMTRICRICGPRAVSSIIGCVTKEA